MRGLAPCQRDLKVDECRYSTLGTYTTQIRLHATFVAVSSSVLMMLMMRDVS